MVKWFDRTHKTARIGVLETSIAKVASGVAQVKEIAIRTRDGVDKVQATLNANHVAHAECSSLQDGRCLAHEEVHERIDRDLKELTELVQRNGEDIRIISASVSRLAEQIRHRGMS